MCGLSGIAGQGWERAQLEAMVDAQRHRGPDGSSIYIDAGNRVGLGHNRLSIIDLSTAASQPMSNQDGSLWIIFNGEIYNYLELRAEIHDYPYRTQSDTEIILAAYQRWGEQCLDHLAGMFAFLLWDVRAQRLFIARDRFGVKPLYYHVGAGNCLFVASEIKALHSAGVPAEPDPAMWATYFAYGLYDHTGNTFWNGVRSLPGGHAMTWEDGRTRIWRWYSLKDRVGPAFDSRPEEVVEEEYSALMAESVRLRFRSDVPVGINLSGGLDSSILLGLVHAVQGPDSDVKAFTYVTGDPQYDELPWVRRMLDRTRHPLTTCLLSPSEVPDLAGSVQEHQDEPFGGIPTLAYARVFEEARRQGVIVLLDGQGMDEQWAGYDYYACPSGEPHSQPLTGPVQGSRDRSVRADCLTAEFLQLAQPLTDSRPFTDSVRNLQYLDTIHAKIPRALRFNDRVSMRASTELREPFLDYRLFELALRQPTQRKIANGVHKRLLRQAARHLLPPGVIETPKRPLQTPQREWIRTTLKSWVDDCINSALGAYGDIWLDRAAVRRAWREYCSGASDNSFYVWQWISLALWQDALLKRGLEHARPARPAAPSMHTSDATQQHQSLRESTATDLQSDVIGHSQAVR